MLLKTVCVPITVFNVSLSHTHFSVITVFFLCFRTEWSRHRTRHMPPPWLQVEPKERIYKLISSDMKQKHRPPPTPAPAMTAG